MRNAVFILGAAGFIGRNLAERLASNGVEIIAATRKPATFNHPRIVNTVAQWDSPREFLEWLPQCRAVIHAASSSTPGSTDARPQLEGNLRTTLALIEALQIEPDCRVVFLSSAGTVYGDRTDPSREDDPLRPRSYHGAGKASTELFLQAWAMQYGGTTILLRPTNVYGPAQIAKSGFGIIPTAFNCALHGQPLPIWDGTSLRDYLYIDDFLALCASALNDDLRSGTHVFNAAFGEPVSLDDLIDRIDVVTGRPITRRYEPARRVDVRAITADTSAARSTFGWSPTVGLHEGLDRTWQWFSTQA